MQTNNQRNGNSVNARRQAEQKIVDDLDIQLVGVQNSVLEAIKNPAAQFIELVELQMEMREKFGLTEGNTEIEKFSELLESLLQFGSVPNSSENVPTMDSSDDASVKRQNNGRFTSKSGLGTGDYAVEAMREIKAKIIPVKEITRVHNLRHPELPKKIRQIGSALRKFARRDHLVVWHRPAKFSLISENTED